jgi:hypothetical protein
MKNCILTAAVAALIGVMGCSNGTTGGPGADKAKQQEKDSKLKQAEDKLSQPEDTFRLTVPTLAVRLKQGEAKEIAIGIKRGKNFDQDVSLKFDGVPTGVTFTPATPVIKHGDAEAKVNVKAADNAALGESTVKATGKPGNGAEATSEIKLVISKK